MTTPPLRTAVVLAGGQGSRLRPLTYAIPKPLLPVGNKPILELLLEGLRGHGVQEVVLATGYQSEMIEAYFRDGARVGLRISYQRETEPRGTAGPLAALRGKLTQPFLLVNGDILTRLDFADLYRFHVEQKAELTVAVRELRWRIPYGVVEVENGHVLAVHEKPLSSHLINAGIYVLDPEVLSRIPADAAYDTPQLMAALARERRVACYRFKAFWLDVGNIRDLERATAEFARWEHNAEPEDAQVEEASNLDARLPNSR